MYIFMYKEKAKFSFIAGFFIDKIGNLRQNFTFNVVQCSFFVPFLQKRQMALLDIFVLKR